MSVEDKIATLEKSVAQLRRKGVTAIKVELEAQLNRGARDDDDYDSEYCEHCDEGRYDCPECWWSTTRDAAVVSCPSCGNDEDSRNDCRRCDGYGNIICLNCDGEGRLNCEHCDGTGYVESDDSSFGRNNDCLDFILAQVEDYTGTRRINNNGNYEEHNPFEWMKYAQFYFDGSVDSELTFTIENSVEAVRYLPSVVKAFRDLADEVGNGLDTRGAGMHMALLFSENGIYPDEAANYPQETLNRLRDESYWNHLPEVSTRLPEQQLRNFKRSLTQLLPALYFLGSPNEVSRGMSYRMPYVSIDDDDRGPNGSKYCAITYRHGAIEYRIFETCYDNPDVILDNVVVMANSIRYLSEEYISPGVDKKSRFIRFGNDSDNNVARFYKTTEHLDALNLGLQRLKPDYYTIRELKQMRKFNYTKHHAKSERSRIVKMAEKAYEEYSERYDFIREVEIAMNTNRYLAQRLQQLSVEEMRKLDMAEARKMAEREAVDNYRRKEDKDTYINNIVQHNLRNLVGEYALDFN